MSKSPSFTDGVSHGKDDLELLVLQVEDLPTMPVIAAQVYQLLASDDVEIKDLTNVIMADPAVAARVVKIANSSFYGTRRGIGTVSEAIMTIGFSALKGVVLHSALQDFYHPLGPTEAMLWEHSCAVAIASRFLASHLGRSLADEAYLAGLVHDIGMQVLNWAAPDRFKQVMALHNSVNGPSIDAAERALYTFTHGEVGGRVLSKWHFPEDLIIPVCYHHSFTTLLEGHTGSRSVSPGKSSPVYMTALVSLADLFCLQLGLGYHRPFDDDLARLPQAGYLGIDPDRMATLLEQFQEGYVKEWRNLMSLE